MSGTGEQGESWAARRGDAAAEHAARLDRKRAAEAEQATALLQQFVRDARERGLPTVALKARALNGRTLYRTGLTGWYLRRNGTLAVDEHGDYYVLSTPDQPAGQAARGHAHAERPAARRGRRRPGRRVHPAARPAAPATGRRGDLGPVSTSRTNWAGNVTFQAARLHRPAAWSSCRRSSPPAAGSVRWAPATRPARWPTPTGDQVSVAGLPVRFEVAPDRRRPRSSAGLRYGEVATRLQAEGLGLANLGSLPHISVGGAVATGAHGSGEVARRPGDLGRRARARHRDRGAAAAGPQRPAVRRRRRRTRLAGRGHRHHARGRADVRRHATGVRRHAQLRGWTLTSTSVLAAGDGVSLFTTWHPDVVDQVWVKRRTDRDRAGAARRLARGDGRSDRPASGGRPARRGVHDAAG